MNHQMPRLKETMPKQTEALTLPRPATLLLAILLTALLPACTTPSTDSPLSPTPLGEAETNVQLALRHMRNNDMDQALQKVNQALKQNPELASANSLAGVLYEKIERPDLAEQFYKKTISLTPQDASARNNYGKLLCGQGKLEEADTQFMLAANNPYNKSPEIAYTNAGLCARRIPDFNRARAYFRAALEKDPQLAVPRYQLAQLYQEQNQHSEAQEELQRYLQVARHTPKTLLLAHQIERSLGNNDAAELYRQQLEFQFPNSDEYLLLVQTEAQRTNTPTFISPAPVVNPESVPNNEQMTTDTTNVAVNAPSPSEQQSINPKANDPLQKEAWLLAQDSQHYTVQLMSGSNKNAIADFHRQYRLPGQLAYYAVKNKGSVWYTLLYGNFSGYSKAREAIKQLPANVRDGKPWIRRFDSIQKEIKSDQASAAQ